MVVIGNKGQIVLFPIRQVKCVGVGRGQPLLFPSDRWETELKIMEFSKAIQYKSLGPQFNAIFFSPNKKTSNLTERGQGRRKR